MPQPSKWLSTLQRLSTQQRDAALAQLAKCVTFATNIHRTTDSIRNEIPRLNFTSASEAKSNRLDLDQLRQDRERRDDLRWQLVEYARRGKDADDAVRQAQFNLASRDAAVEVVRRLSERLNEMSRDAKRRQDEQCVLESLNWLGRNQVGE